MASRALSKELRGEIARSKRKVRLNALESADRDMLVAGGAALAGGGLAAFVDSKFGDGATANWGESSIPINLTVGPAVALGSVFLGRGMLRSGLMGAGIGATIVGGARLLAEKLGGDGE